MTGACNSGNILYFLGKDYYSNPVIQKFTTAGSTSGVYMSSFPGLGSTYYDIAWLSGGIWIARDNADSPILAYNTGGMCIGYVDGADIGGAAAGLAMDGDGHLWVSNPDNDTIYLLDVTTGIEEGQGSSIEGRSVSVSANPFHSSVTISAEGFGSAMLDIFDLTGRRVLSSEFHGAYTWSGADVPAGTYYARIADAVGAETVSMVRVD